MSRYLSFASVLFLLLLVSCQKEKSFEQGKLSKGSLQGNFGDCLTKTVNGVYTATKSLADTNYIDVDVDVTETGRYTIYTDTVNGYFFKATGTFSTAGANTVRMKGFGTPGSEGTNDFTVFYDSGFCNVSVTVGPDGGTGGGSTSGDYFPTTTNSNWSYEFNSDPNDTLLRKAISATKNASGNTYNIFMATIDATQGFDSSGYYRKSNGNYYEFIDAAAELGFDNSVWMEYIFLKDNVAVNTSWTSPTINGTISGSTIIVRNKFTILQKDIMVTVQGKSYPNTIVVEQRVEQSTGSVWVDVSAAMGILKIYYAEGVGMIKQEFTDPSGTSLVELTRSQVF